MAVRRGDCTLDGGTSVGQSGDGGKVPNPRRERLKVPVPWLRGRKSPLEREARARGAEESSPLAGTRQTSDEPTVFHVTHWKAGSQWIHRIFHGLVYERLVLPQVDRAQFLDAPIQPGKIYPTVYVTKQEFDSVVIPADFRRFVVIRDLRDTLVSWYYSYRISHAILAERFAVLRRKLDERNEEEGMLLLLDEELPRSADIQRSWLEAGEELVRYEDLLEDDLGILEELLLRRCELRVSQERFREIVLANRFERITGGRRLGEEDRSAHERQGAPGDWRNHLTARVKRSFKERYGELLIATGYARDLDW
jgi:Sulfotransferase domain